MTDRNGDLGTIGSLFGSKGEDSGPKEIPIEHLDYDYVRATTPSRLGWLGVQSDTMPTHSPLCVQVRECKNWRYLKRLLDLLVSGKEGRYFALEKFTEERMLEVMPQRHNRPPLKPQKKLTPPVHRSCLPRSAASGKC